MFVFLAFGLAACSAQSGDQLAQTEDQRRYSKTLDGYFGCMKTAAKTVERASLAPMQISEEARLMCVTELKAFAEALRTDLEPQGELDCKDSASKVTCILRDSYEASIIRSIENDVSKRRGLPVKEELTY